MRPGKAVPSSRARCAFTVICIVSEILHNTQMPMRAAIVGCAGYAGQHTVDRVLSHTEPARAGRGLKASSHVGVVLENFSAYRVGAHQHAPEIGQALGFPVCFVPHLLPVRRGLLATCYARATADDLRARLEDAYGASSVVR